jgi:hypothetical protein
MKPSTQSERESVAESDLETLLNEHEYARITKRSVASVRRDRLLGQGCPYVKLGALVRYRPQDVRAHLERSLHRTTSLSQPSESAE